jgi:hypothetical protein
MVAYALETPVADAGGTLRLRRALRWRRASGRQTGGAAVTTAVRQFTVRTITRSRPHRTLLAIYLGLGLAIIVSSIVPLVVRGARAFATPDIAVLAAPLVLTFMALVGMRVAFAIPVDINANWVVRLREPGEIFAAMNGVLSAMLRWAVVPGVVLAGVSTGALWGPRVATIHVVFCALLGWLLAELLLLVFCKIPFTCTYLPGRSQVKTLWPLYFTAFLTFTYTAAGLELQLLRFPRARAIVFITIAIAAIVARILRRTWLASEPSLRFVEDDPDALFEGFHLSEGLAARMDKSGIGGWGLGAGE